MQTVKMYFAVNAFTRELSKQKIEEIVKKYEGHVIETLEKDWNHPERIVAEFQSATKYMPDAFYDDVEKLEPVLHLA